MRTLLFAVVAAGFFSAAPAYAQRYYSGDPFRSFFERAKKESWQHFEMDASHSPHVTAPEALAEILDQIAKS